jgi:4-amino-4-deoxy-L-arabinose transferase-like glycosyltransferase
MKSNRFFDLFLLSLIILLFLPNLLQRGMFVDGLWYSTISKNLADGLGSFWYPCFTKTMYPVFNEHPPLVFGIQSFFFKFFGSSVYVEKIFALFIICLTIILIRILWRTLFTDKPEFRNLGFIPILLWVLHETTYLYYPNNLLECTQGVFILLSVILILTGLREENFLSYLYIFLAGISLILSFLSKGFTGLYPLITIFIYHVIIRKIHLKKLVIYNAILFASFGLLIFLYLFNQSASDNLNNYINTQVFAALKGERIENMHPNRFYIVKRLLETSILPVALTILVTLISYIKYGAKYIFRFRKEFLFFIVLGLSGVLPMMVSQKQGTYYLITTIPYFSIALGLLLISNESVLNWLRKSISFKIITILLLLFSIIYPLFSINKINKRDRTLVEDIDQFDEILEQRTTIGCIVNKNEYSLYGFFMRNYDISLDTKNPYNYPWIVCDKNLPFDSAHYEPMNLETKKFYLLKKKS